MTKLEFVYLGSRAVVSAVLEQATYEGKSGKYASLLQYCYCPQIAVVYHVRWIVVSPGEDRYASVL